MALIDGGGGWGWGGGWLGNKQGLWSLPKYLIPRGGVWNKRLGWKFSRYFINGEENRIEWNLNNLAKIGNLAKI